MHPDSPLAPKAIYSMIWICENRLDSLDRALSLCDSLVGRYPGSVFAETVKPKVEAARKLPVEEEEVGSMAEEEEILQSPALPDSTTSAAGEEGR
jgi:hypothetical protein